MVKNGDEVTNSNDRKIVNNRKFERKSRKRKIIALIVFCAVLVSIIDILIGHYHIFLIPKKNMWRAEPYFSHDGVNYYLRDVSSPVLFYGFFPTSLKREIKSGRLTYDELTRKAIKKDPKCWCDMMYYTTSFAKFIYCGKSPLGKKVVIIPITAEFDGKYCK